MKSSWKGLILYEARHTIHLSLSRGKTVKKCNFYVAALFGRGGWQGRRGLTIIEIQGVNKHQQNQTRTILFLQAIFSTICQNNRAGAMRKYLTRKCRYFSEADIKVCVASYNGCGKALYENAIVFQPGMKVCVGGRVAVKMYGAIGSTTNSGSAKGEVEAI